MPEHRLQNLSKKGLRKPRISPKSPTDYGTDPEILSVATAGIAPAILKVR
jgi:hypothetical protein